MILKKMIKSGTFPAINNCLYFLLPESSNISENSNDRNSINFDRRKKEFIQLHFSDHGEHFLNISY